MSAAPITAPTETTPTVRANSAPAAGDAALFQLLLGATSESASTQPIIAPPSTNAPTAASPIGVLTLQTEPGAAFEAPAAVLGEEAKGAVTSPADPAALPVSTTPSATTPETPLQQPLVVPPQTSAPQQAAATQVAPPQDTPTPAQTAPQQTAVAQPTQSKNAQPKKPQAEADASTVSEETPAEQPKTEAAPNADAPPQPGVTLPTALAAQAIAPQLQSAPQRAAAPAAEQSETPIDGAAPIKFAGPAKKGATATAANASGPTPNAGPVAMNANNAERGAAAPLADTMTSAPAVLAPANTSAQPAAADSAAQTAAARPALQSPAAMSLAQQIVRRFDGQSISFQMRMDPPELGKVEVRMTVDRNKKVTASVSADNPQALTELRASARELERALNEAGLDLAQDGLSFNLHDNGDAQRGDYAGASASAAASSADEDFAALTPAARPFGMERWGGGGVDVWA
jgi:hypothetical protein